MKQQIYKKKPSLFLELTTEYHNNIQLFVKQKPKQHDKILCTSTIPNVN
jgi:hypothetical protein